MAFHIRGLEPEQFEPLYGLSEEDLAAQGVIRCPVDETPGFPDRVSMTDLQIGDVALLLNYEHLPVTSPYRSRHAIFVKEGATVPYDATDEVPEVMSSRILSLRAIDAKGHIIDAGLAQGAEIEATIRMFLGNPAVDYIHAHFAQRGCFAARIDRA